MALASALLTVMLDAVRKTARPMLRDFGEVAQLQVSRKGPGDFVTAGATVVVMEAMKMEHHISAPADGIFTEVFVQVGQQVGNGTDLLLIESETPGDPGASEEGAT